MEERMYFSHRRKWFPKTACLPLLALSAFGFAAADDGAERHDQDKPAHTIETATPIKHVIIIVGENRSFDHIFGTYTPNRRNEKVMNLLSEGIVKADGSLGPNFAKAHQFKIVSAPN